LDKISEADENPLILYAGLRQLEKWPEYVASPKNPLAFLGLDMTRSFFNVIKNS
jgi:hypothetical protein